MNTNARLVNADFAPKAWRGSRSRHSLLAEMARQAAEMAAQGARIKELRERTRDPDTGKKLTQEGLAAAIHVRARTVQLWEAGRIGEVKAENVKALADYFGVPESYIEYGPEEPRGETPDLSVARNHAPPPPDLAALQQQLNRIEALLSQQLTGQQLAEKFDLASVEQASRVEAILQRLARAEETIQASLRQRPA